MSLGSVAGHDRPDVRPPVPLRRAHRRARTALAAAHPELMTLETAGHVARGPRRSGSRRSPTPPTGPHDEKPALFVEANIHATEITASTAALHLVHHLARGYGTDDAVTRALDTRTFYVIPRAQPRRRRAGARARIPTYLRSSTRIYPRPDQQPGPRRAGRRRRRPHPHACASPTRTARGRSTPTTRACSCRAALDEVGPGDYYRLLPEGDPRVRRRR